MWGYMLSAKVGTGIVAELGAMRISDEIDALEVMGIDSVTFLCATRLLAAWLVLPFMYIAAIGVAFLASYIAIVHQLGYVSSGGYLLIFWQFQNPGGLLIQRDQGHDMATCVVLVACYYGYNASGGPVGRGPGDGQVDGAQPGAREPDRHVRDADLLGRQRPAPRSGARAGWPTRSASVPPDGTPSRRSSFHTGVIRGLGVPDAIEFVDVYKSFGRNHVCGAEHGAARGQDLDDHRALRDRQVGLHQAHRGLLYPDEGDVIVKGRSIPSLATPRC